MKNNLQQHDLLREYIRVLISGDTNSLIVKGEGGLGKSFTFTDELEKQGLEENVHYLYISGHITPLELYETLNKVNLLEYPKLALFDDIDALLTNTISVALLKACLWEVKGKRVVSYKSSRKKEAPQAFDFKGKVAMILNDLKQEAQLGKPLLDRAMVFEMSMTAEETVAYIEKVLNGPDFNPDIPLVERLEIWKRIKFFATNPRFSMRTLVRAFAFYRYSKENWFSLFLSSLKLTPEEKIWHEVQAKSVAIQKTGGKIKIREEAREWAEKTGKSVRTYYRMKNGK